MRENGFEKITRGADNCGPSCHESAGRLDPNAGQDAGYQEALSGQIDTFKHLICRRGRAEFSRHSDFHFTNAPWLDLGGSTVYAKLRPIDEFRVIAGQKQGR